MPARFNPIKIFSGTASHKLSEKIAAEFGQPLGSVTLNKFSDGEMQPSFNETVRGCDVFIIQSTHGNSENWLELLLMIDAAKRASANYITAVLPYFGYARQDRKDKPRVPIASKMMANILTTSGASRLMTMDLHAAQIQGFFDIPVDHLDSSVIFIPYLRHLNLDNLVIGSPDVGGTNRARFFARHLECDLIICDKERKKANQVASMNLIGDVKDKNVVLVDDLIDTAGTLGKASTLIMEKGARSVRAMITHPVLSGNAYENIEKSALTELVVCDTIPLLEKSNKIKTLSVSRLFSQAIQNVYQHGSISSLFRMPNSQQTTLEF